MIVLYLRFLSWFVIFSVELRMCVELQLQGCAGGEILSGPEQNSNHCRR